MKREIVTPYLLFIFMIVVLSGVLMFFHILDDYTNVVHEFLGLAFGLFSILHIVNNWKSITNYSKKRLLFLPAIVILIVATTFVVLGKRHGNLEEEMLHKLIKSPAYNSFTVLHGDYRKAKAILANANIAVKDSSNSIEEISVITKRSPEEIVELIIK